MNGLAVDPSSGDNSLLLNINKSDCEMSSSL
jgi:hypothetical protein